MVLRRCDGLPEHGLVIRGNMVTRAVARVFLPARPAARDASTLVR